MTPLSGLISELFGTFRLRKLSIFDLSVDADFGNSGLRTVSDFLSLTVFEPSMPPPPIEVIPLGLLAVALGIRLADWMGAGIDD